MTPDLNVHYDDFAYDGYGGYMEIYDMPIKDLTLARLFNKKNINA